MEVIARRKRLDATEPGTLEVKREHDVAIEPRSTRRHPSNDRLAWKAMRIFCGSTSTGQCPDDTSDVAATSRTPLPQYCVEV